MDWEYINDIVKDLWIKFYYNSNPITEYGREGYTEDFADYYAIMVGFEYDSNNHREIVENRDNRKEYIIEHLLREYPVFDLRKDKEIKIRGEGNRYKRIKSI